MKPFAESLETIRNEKGTSPDPALIEAVLHGFPLQEFLYRDLLNALPAAIYTTDGEGRITFYNEAAVEFSGRRPVIGSDEWCVTWRLYHMDGRPMPHSECPMAVALKEGREIRGAEAIAERPDGTRIVFQPYPTLLRDEAGKVVGAVNMLVDITERKAAEERQRLLTNEVNHRANNLLAVVQSFVNLTAGGDVEAYRKALTGRVQALARAHALLAKSAWTSADLLQLVTEELSPYLGRHLGGVRLCGTSVPLQPSAVQALAMVLHELRTNAARHGALSAPTGRVAVEWQDNGGDIVLRWVESGGPAARTPRHKGLGENIIRRAAAQIGGRVKQTWRPAGLSAELTIPREVFAA